MSYGLWLSAGGLQVNEYRQNLAANNLANVETVGFKRDFAVLHERDVESATRPGGQTLAHPLLDDLAGGPWVRPTMTSFAEGALDPTGRPLDIALHGDGFLAVREGDDVRYTRDGRLTVGANGALHLADANGRFQVLGLADAPIFVDDVTLGPLQIDRAGVISQDGEDIGRLKLVDFDDRAQLRKRGANLFEYVGDTAPRAATPHVESGHLERSAVNPINALVNMIEVTRTYQLNARMITLQDETIGQAVSRVGRIG